MKAAVEVTKIWLGIFCGIF